MQIKKLYFLFAVMLLLTGCNGALTVHDAQVDKITTILKDYSGIHGYQISYQNEQTGSYRLELGVVYIPEASQMVKTRQATTEIPAKDQKISQTLTSYEETTWQTVSQPGHYVQASAMVRIIQQGKDVHIILQSESYNGPWDNQLGDLHDYIEDFGYSVDYQ
jgi:hypothetical protein